MRITSIFLIGIGASLSPNSSGFITSPIRTSLHTVSKSRNEFHKVGHPRLFSEQSISELDGKDKINAEVEKALKEAEAALNMFVEDKDEAKEAKQRVIQAQQQAASLAQKKVETRNQVEGVVAGIGGVLFGFVSGGTMDIFFKVNNFLTDVDIIIPPIILAFTFGAVGVVLGQEDSETGDLVRNIFAAPLKALTDSITTAVNNKIEETVTDIKATPGKIQTAIEKKVQETTDEIKQIPVQVQKSVDAKVEQTVDDIRQIPVKTKKAAAKAVKKAKDEITDATIRTVEEIKATPGRIVEETKEAFVTKTQKRET